MGNHPIDNVVGEGLPVNKAAFNSELRQYVREFGTVANFRTYDLNNTPSVLINAVFYKYDPLDLTTPDNGTTCILDVSSRRFKKVALSIAGETIFRVSVLAGTVNALIITSNGMATLSATPQLLIIIPSANNTITGITAVIDGAASIPILSPNGNALKAGEWVGGEPYLVSVTSTAATIYNSGVTW